MLWLMNADLLISVGVVAVGAALLYFKTHIRFIALGLFLGLALAQGVAITFHETVGSQLDWLNNDLHLSSFQLFFLVVPAIILGLNHSVEKKKKKGTKAFSIFFVVITTVFFLSSIISLLPDSVSKMVMERSVLAATFVELQLWITLLMAVLILLDSFFHKAAVLKEKK